MREYSHSLSAWCPLFLKWPLLPASFFVMMIFYQSISNYLLLDIDRLPGMKVYGLPLDAHIPFLPYTLPLYLCFFSFYLLHKPLLSSAINKPMVFWRIEAALIVMTVISCVFFVLLPTQVELRDHALLSLQTGIHPQWLVDACGGLFLLDARTNAWPSIHVSQPLFIMLAVSHLRLYSARKLVVLWVLLGLVVFSVLAMKQHYVWDVVTGALLALLVSQLVFYAGPLRDIPVTRLMGVPS
jgi:hypothetical protein